MKGMLFDIQRASTVDGPGFRTTVFFKGCNLRCAAAAVLSGALHALWTLRTGLPLWA